MSTKPTFLLVHGTWHGAWCWSEMTTRLAKAGYPFGRPGSVGVWGRRALSRVVSEASD